MKKHIIIIIIISKTIYFLLYTIYYIYILYTITIAVTCMQPRHFTQPVLRVLAKPATSCALGVVNKGNMHPKNTNLKPFHYMLADQKQTPAGFTCQRT